MIPLKRLKGISQIKRKITLKKSEKLTRIGLKKRLRSREIKASKKPKWTCKKSKLIYKTTNKKVIQELPSKKSFSCFGLVNIIHHFTYSYKMYRDHEKNEKEYL